jgi:hypothetical protein
MSAAPSPIFWQDPPSPLGELSFYKAPPYSTLASRATNTAKDIIHFVGEKAAAMNLTAEPGTTAGEVTLFELRQNTRKSMRAIETAIDEIRDKNFAEVKSYPRAPGRWVIRLLPQNWRQKDGEPGGPIAKSPRKDKVRTASHDFVLPKAALANSPQVVTEETTNSHSQFSASQFSAEELFAAGFRFDPVTGTPLGQRTTGEESQKTAEAHLYIRESSGEEPQAAAEHFSAKQPTAVPPQPDVGIPASDCAHPIRERDYFRGEEKLASPAQPAAEAELTQLLAAKGITVPNEATCRNLLDRNKYKGPALPGPSEVAAFIVVNQGRRSWKENTGEWKWGVVMTSVREDMMPSLYAQGWPPPPETGVVLPGTEKAVLPGTEKAMESMRRRLAILKAMRPDLE